MTDAELIAFYGLLPHAEGGFYKETYRSGESIARTALPGRFTGYRAFSTAIYFLLQQGQFSAFHRIKSDEAWHFYAGGVLNIYVIHPDGELELIRLGNNITDGEIFQAIVPAGCWFASKPEDGDFSFVGCTVAPGFDFADFELAPAVALSAAFPQYAALIRSLTRG